MDIRKQYQWIVVIFFLGLPSGWLQAVRGTEEPLPPFQREPINVAKIGEASDVLLVGDDHTQRPIKTFLIDQLTSLHTLGFRCLAIEMLPSRFQPALDRWHDSDQQRIQTHLARFWGEKGAGIPESFFALIAAAKREGFQVVALDPDEPSSLNREDVNPHWVDCVRRCLIDQKGKKMIVFGGSSHFRDQPQSVFARLLAQGIRCSVLEFSGLENPDSVERDLTTARLLEKAVPWPLQITSDNIRLGVHGSFMVHGPSKITSSDAARWVINLDPAPQPPLRLASK